MLIYTHVCATKMTTPSRQVLVPVGPLSLAHQTRAKVSQLVTFVVVYQIRWSQNSFVWHRAYYYYVLYNYSYSFLHPSIHIHTYT